jgi:hypothetical protein
MKASGGSRWESPDSIMRPGYRPRLERARHDPFDDENEDVSPPEAASVNGSNMEAVVIRSGRSSTGNGDLVRRGTNRDVGLLEARNRVWEDIANKMLPPEESELMVKFLKRGPDETSKRTYLEGIPQPQVDEHAPIPWVGLTFLPGADKPQVARQEQTNMAGGEPDQKDAMWRANTAASLLMSFEVDKNLAVVERYNANDVQPFLDRNRKLPSPLQRRESRSQANRTSNNNTQLVKKVPGREPLTIDSDYVKIVHNLHEHQWDLQSTLIEVDGSSLLNLIVNFRHIISRGGPDMSFEETKTLLDRMIEDARRLCVRSPVLFRMSTRNYIINSKNTRYGINHSSMFRTLTTSQGIKEIVSLSASYYNSLDPIGSSDKTQEHIRPRFLQMTVMLLSLLNDDDLFDLKEFLESTYKLKADRKHLEMLFLKVIPLMSINSKVFFSSLVPCFEGFPLPPKYTDTECWDIFVERILKEGYLLPGSADDLGREKKSWIVKWPEDGFKSTLVFNHLQYAAKGDRARTINDIPAIEVHPESSLTEVPVLFTNLETYTIDKDDLERITCLTHGAYTVKEACQGGRSYDLTIIENHINGDLNEAIRRTNALVTTLNVLTGFIKRGFMNKWTGRGEHEIRLLSECRNSGRITKSTAELQGDTLAVAYKFEGRKITTRDAMRTMGRDIQKLRWLLESIDRRITEISNETTNKAQLRFEVKEINSLLIHAERARNGLNESDLLSDEPIAKVLTGGLGETGAPVWFDYATWYRPSERHMHFEAKRSHVQDVRWLSDANIEVTLTGHNSKFYVSPLHPVLESQQDDEIRPGDIAILAGKYMILADADEGDEGEGSPLFMSNYLRITSVQEVTIQRRGRNRAQQVNSNVVTLFR